MNLSGPFIRRPVATSLLAAGLLLLGSVAFRILPVSRLPEFDYATFSVYATLPGADPSTVASSVAAPLERRFAQIAGVAEMTSSSSLGTTLVALQFDLSRDTEGAAHDIEAAINAAGPQLPRDLITNPYYRKENPSQTPFMLLALTSDVLPMGDVYAYGETVLAPRLAQVEGISSVGLGGTGKSAIRVQVNPGRLASMKLGLEDIRSVLKRANADLPTGRLDGDAVSYGLRVNDQLLAPAEYRSLVVRNAKGSAIRLGDISEISESVENVDQAAWFGRTPAVTFHMQKEAGFNMIETADRIRKLLPQLIRALPAGMKLSLISDRTATIRLSVRHIEFTLLLSVALVVMVVFVFLRRFWATAIPSFTLPLVLAGTFATMYVMRYTIDNLTLMALAIAVGFVVDDSIVVIENIVRLIEAGVPPFEAALKGARQVGFTVISISLSLVAVFIPVLFMGGIVGRLFHEFVVTLSAAVLISAAVSFTFTPMMCSRFLAREFATPKTGLLPSRLESGIEALHRAYRRGIEWALRHRPLMLFITAATMAGTVWLYVVIPKGFFPSEDNGFMLCNVECAQDASFAVRSQKQQEANEILLRDPAIEAFDSLIRPGFPGVMYVQLKPLEVRKIGIEAVIARLRRMMGRIEGATIYMRSDQDLKIGARTGKTAYQYTLRGSDIGELTRASQNLLGAMRKLRQLRDVNTDLAFNGLEARVVVNRDVAGRLGISQSQIDATLYDAFGQRQVSTIYTAFDQRHIILEANAGLLLEPSSLNKVYLTSSTGRMTPLGAIAHTEFLNAPVTINHQGQYPAVTISFNLAPGIAISQATEAVEQIVDRMRLPGSIRGSFEGTAKAFESTLADQPLLICAAIAVVYIVLGMLYESLIHPVTILSTLPSAGIGALLALRLFGYDLSVIALIGIILLVGIVKRNAIILVDFALDLQRKDGLAPEAAIHQACITRFRPILMTSLVALFGALPLAIQGGVGAELHKPLGISIIGGLIVSQLLTLFSTPVVYLFMDNLHLHVRRFLTVSG